MATTKRYNLDQTWYNFSAHQAKTRASRTAADPKMAVQDVCKNLLLLFISPIPIYNHFMAASLLNISTNNLSNILI